MTGGIVNQKTPEEAARILPAYDTVGKRELSEAVHQALGAASVCWEPMDCTGVFEGRRAEQIGAELMGIVGQYADDFAAQEAHAARAADDCPIAVVLADGMHDCTLTAGHGGDHDFADEVSGAPSRPA